MWSKAGCISNSVYFLTRLLIFLFLFTFLCFSPLCQIIFFFPSWNFLTLHTSLKSEEIHAGLLAATILDGEHQSRHSNQHWTDQGRLTLGFGDILLALYSPAKLGSVVPFLHVAFVFSSYCSRIIKRPRSCTQKQSDPFRLFRCPFTTIPAWERWDLHQLCQISGEKQPWIEGSSLTVYTAS